MHTMPSDHPLLPAIALYKFGDELLDKALQGLSRDELLHRAGPTSNPIIWLAGHIAITRFRIGNVLGPPEDVPLEYLFGARSRPEHVLVYPDLSVICGLHRSATERLYARIAGATPGKLQENTPRSNRSVREMVHQMAYHEALHVGQILFLRKVLGHTSDDPIMD